eukprot:1180917-Prorocentrum_minimum.AAC.8
MADHDAEQAAAVASRLRRNELANLDTVRKARDLLSQISQNKIVQGADLSAGPLLMKALHDLAALVEREERRWGIDVDNSAVV